jgi:ATPase subunit of ABC transporter with duplicated ATPase domains
MSIVVKQLSYIHSNREYLFQDLNFSVAQGHKVALVGPNGAGKSTLMYLIAGKIFPASGEIAAQDKPYVVPQHFGQYDQMTVAEALGIDQKIMALHSILNGDAAAEYFSTLDDDWGIEESAFAALGLWDLPDISLSQKLAQFSGGEKTRIFLAGIAIHKPALILMDEPSNHLDKSGREQLYHLIQSVRATIIVVSHDRTLLNLLDSTYELSKTGMTLYGGNYEFYKTQKELQLHSLAMQAEHQEKDLRKARELARSAAERKQKENARGHKKQVKKGMPKIVLDMMKNAAEQSTAKLQDVHNDKIKGITENLQQIKQQLPETTALQLTFDDAALHSGKMLIEATQLNFSYLDGNLWPDPLNFKIRSGDRISITGVNGSGKTTLIELILGKLEPTTGSLDKANFQYLYVDQEYAMIVGTLTVFEQVQEFNLQHLPEHRLKTLLHQFLFGKDMWDKKCLQLSGGEKMKLIFCCLLISNHAPDMIILDEPTNNLDIGSLEIVTNAIRSYQGTLLLISHDQYFMKETGIDQIIELKKLRLPKD